MDRIPEQVRVRMSGAPQLEPRNLATVWILTMLMEITRADRVFLVYPSQELALKSYSDKNQIDN